MIKTQKLLTALFIILLLSALLLFFSNRKSTLQSKAKNFAVKNIEQVDKIIISKGLNKILFIKENNNWKINGTFKGNPKAMNFLLLSLSRLEVRSPVSNVHRERIINMLDTNSKIIEIYSNNKLVKYISLYHDTSEIVGTYMILKNSYTPFLMKIKGYKDINIDRVFSLNTQIWCENTILDYMPDEIKNLIVEYPDEPDKSFQIINSGKQNIYLKHPDDPQVINNFSIEKVTEYLYSFTNIKFNFPDKTDFNNPAKSKPFVIITLTNIKDESIVLEGYRKYMSGDLNKDSGYDIDNFYAVKNYESELIELKYIDFDPILKDMDYFLKK